MMRSMYLKLIPLLLFAQIAVAQKKSTDIAYTLWGDDGVATWWGVIVSCFLSVVTLILLWRQNAIAHRQATIAEAQTGIQQAMQAHAEMQAQSQLFILLYLKVMEDNRKLDTFYIELARDASNAAEFDIEFERKRVQGATRSSLLDMLNAKTAEHRARIEKDPANVKRRNDIELSLYPGIESISYLIEKKLITDPTLVNSFQQDFAQWKAHMQDNMHVQGFPIFGRYPYFTGLYTQWQWSNPHATEIPPMPECYLQAGT